MATAIRGDVGKIMFHNAAGTEADVAGTRSWSLTINKDTLETTAQGDTAGNSDYQAFIDDVLVTGDAADALFELFPDSATSAKKISFSGIITSADYGATLGETQLVTVNFITSGAITSAI